MTLDQTTPTTTALYGLLTLERESRHAAEDAFRVQLRELTDRIETLSGDAE